MIRQNRLRNNFLKYKCEANNRAYNAQKNICASLMRKAKQDDFDNLNHKKDC